MVCLKSASNSSCVLLCSVVSVNDVTTDGLMTNEPSNSFLPARLQMSSPRCRFRVSPAYLFVNKLF